MASKKVFTSLAFQSGAKLIAPKVEAISPLTNLTSKVLNEESNTNYYTGAAGQLAYSDSNLYLNVGGTGGEWTQVHNAKSAFSTDQTITSTLTGAAPLVVAATDLVVNLTAESLGNGSVTPASTLHPARTTAIEHAIPIYGTNGILKVGTPVADDDASSKGYVDNAVQGLDHKESVVAATTANITTATALNNADTLDNVTLQDGDRVLVKDQTTASQNGIYIVGATPVLANDSNLGSELIENGTFTGTSGAPSGWTAPGGATLTLDANRMKVLGGYALDSFTTVVGKTYRLQLDLTANDPGGFYLGSSANAYDIMSSGALSSNLTAATYYFVAKSTTTYLSLYAWHGGTQYAFYDNVSVKEDNLTEGAYVFVEKGTANENSSWVLSAKATKTSAPGNTWTQFSGAGQITAGDGLAKSGDTLSVDLAASTPLEFASNKLSMAAIDTGDLADDAVEPAKLLETGDFQMAKLGLGVAPTATVQIGSHTNTMPTDTALFVSINSLRFSTTNNNADYGSYLKPNYDNGNPNASMLVLGTRFASVDSDVLTLNGSKIGIGADATSPSGTLHVSTARYGSELATNGGLESGDLTGWSKIDSGGSSTTQTANNTSPIAGSWDCKNVCTGNANGYPRILVTLTALTIGRKYVVSYKAKASSAITPSYVSLRVGTGGTELALTGGQITTSVQTFTQTIVAAAAYTKFILYLGNSDGKTVYLDDVTVKEDSLAAGVDSDGDDLVVSGKDETGISIISQANTDAGIYFGDGLSDAFSKILSKRALDGTGTLKLDVDSSTALELDSSQNVKIPNGGLGIGVTPSGARLHVASSYDGNWISVISNTHATNGHGLKVQAGDDGDVTAFRVSNVANTTLLQVDGAGLVTVPTGNVAIGATSTTEKLLVVGPGGADPLHLNKGSGTGGIKFTFNGTNYVSYIRTYEAGTQSDNYMGFGVSTGNNTTSFEALRLKGDGSHDHKANSIVNSASIQGLQDSGACYDFDGTDDYVKITGLDPTSLSYITVSVWVKIDAKSSWGGIISQTETGSLSDGWGMHFTSSTSDIIQWWVSEYTPQNCSLDVSGYYGEWIHLVGTYDGTDQKLYLNGVEVDSAAKSWDEKGESTREVRVGCLSTTGNAPYYFLNGKVRDVKILPSALTDGDVRKLYSGENPKKNLNVPIYEEDTADDSTSNWYKDTNQTLAYSGGFYLQTNPNNTGHAGVWTANIGVTAGKTYKASFKVKNGTSTGVSMFFGLREANGSAFVAENNSITTTGNLTEYSIIGTPATSTVYIYIRVGGNTAGSGNIQWTDAQLTEVGTLVDFNPRSASSDTWHNAAIPALYNGSLEGGVTLSAGSTDHKVDGDLEVDGKLGVGISAPSKRLHVYSGASGVGASGDVNMILEGASSVGLAMLAPNNQGSRIEFGSAADNNEGIIYYNNTGSYFSIYTNGTRKVDITSAGRLGIGTDDPQSKTDIVEVYPDSGSAVEGLQLLIRGGQADLDPAGDSIGMGFGYGNAPDYIKSGIISEFTSTTGRSDLHLCTTATAGAATVTKSDARLTVKSDGKVGIGRSPDTNFHLHSATDECWQYITTDVANKDTGLWFGLDYDGTANYSGLVFDQSDDALKLFNANSISNHLVVKNDGKLGVGTATPQALLDISSSSTGDYPLIIRSDIDNVGGYTGIKFGYNNGNTNHQKAAIQVRGTSGHVQPDMHFMLNTAASEASVADADADRVFTLRNAGTQDHWANRIVNSQTVSDLNRTAEPSLRFDGVDDYVQLGLTNSYLTNAFTVSAWIKVEGLPTGGQSGIWGNFDGQVDGFAFGLDQSGNLYYRTSDTSQSGGGVINGTMSAGTAITTGVWTQITVVFDKTNAKLIYYRDGVHVETDEPFATTPAVLDTDGNNVWIGRFPFANISYFNGEIKDVRLHNRVLDSDEVAAAYNGESTPFLRADAYRSKVSDFSSDTDTWGAGGGGIAGNIDIGGRTDTLRFTCNTATSTHYIHFNNGGNWSPVGRTIRITFDYYVPSGQSNIDGLGCFTYGQSGAPYYSGLNTTDAWTPVSMEFDVTQSYGFIIYGADGGANTFTDAAGNDTFYIKNFTYKEVGEIAAYTPQSINDKWYDTTSNANHGTITGATTVGNTRHLGALHIKGKDTAKIILENTVTDTNLDIDYLNESGSTQARIRYDEGWGRFEISPNTATAPRFTIDYGGSSGAAVKATSATSGNLIQVARVFNTGSSPLTGDGSRVHFNVAHNLGTEYCTVSVQEETNDVATDGQIVETEVRSGKSWSDTSSVYQDNPNYVVVTFATAPASGVKFGVTVTG